jgi:hypothetical protein
MPNPNNGFDLDLLLRARRLLRALADGTSDYENFQALSNEWLATKDLKPLMLTLTSDPHKRAGIETLLQAYFCEGFLLAIRARQEEMKHGAH